MRCQSPPLLEKSRQNRTKRKKNLLLVKSASLVIGDAASLPSLLSFSLFPHLYRQLSTACHHLTIATAFTRDYRMITFNFEWSNMQEQQLWRPGLPNVDVINSSAALGWMARGQGLVSSGQIVELVPLEARSGPASGPLAMVRSRGGHGPQPCHYPPSNLPSCAWKRLPKPKGPMGKASRDFREANE